MDANTNPGQPSLIGGKSLPPRDRKQKILLITLFSAVPLFLLFTFTYVPFANMFRFSLFNMKYLGPKTFAGLSNYLEVFTREDIFHSLSLSFYYMAASFVQLALALFFATLLSGKTRGSNFFKGALFFPFLVNGIAVGYIFKFFFTRGFVFDSLLTGLGIPQELLPYWLQNTSVNNIALAASSIWRYMGQNMVLFIGAIQSVDPQLYEAAELDGANRWHQFRYIILSSISTIVVLNLILSISGSLSAFEPPYVITNGRFGTSTYFLTMHKIAHEYQKVGLASAMAIVLFALIIMITLIQKGVARAMTNGDENFAKPRHARLRPGLASIFREGPSRRNKNIKNRGGK